MNMNGNRYFRVSRDEQTFLRKLPELSGSSVKVYVAVARAAGDRYRDELVMSVRYICTKTGLQWPTVQRALQELQKARLIDQTPVRKVEEEVRQSYSSYSF